MKQLFYRFTFIFLLIIISCQSEEKQQNEASKREHEEDSLFQKENTLYKEVMTIHDEIMPAMSDIYSLNKQVKIAFEKETDSDKKERLTQLSQELEAANEGMMIWMRNFDPDLDSMNQEETTAYLKKEKEKIKNVRKDMQLAMGKTKDYLKDR